MMAAVRSTFAYRKWSPLLGGLAADLEAELKAVEARPENSVTVHGRIWLTVPSKGIYWKDLSWLAFGASLMQPTLSDAYPEGVQVHVHDLVYPLADYRPEVAAVCMVGWLSRELNAPDPGVVVSPALDRGTYVFEWGDLTGDPFTE